jgi:hypothetical protein
MPLIKLVLPKTKIGRNTEGTRNTDTQATSRSHKLLERYIVGFTQSVHQGMRMRRVCQSSAGWKDIDLAHEFVSVLMRPVTTSTKNFSSF